MHEILRRTLFWLGLLFCLTPWASPPIALALGLVLGLTLGHPHAAANRRWVKILLQVSVVGLGFGIELGTVLEASGEGIVFTMATIVGTLLLGALLGKLLGIDRRTTHLISSGTAICGGSAIAAVGPVVDAGESEMSVSLGTVFILNAVALFVFPEIGRALALTQEQFGIWAAVAIHDTSSVVGAAARYGDEALAIATTVKLVRALWIIPLVLVSAAMFRHRGAKLAIPWFILLFFVASIARTTLDPIAEIAPWIVAAARIGLTVTLFLIGAGLTRRMLAAVGARPLVLGITLWIVISVVSLWAVYVGV